MVRTRASRAAASVDVTAQRASSTYTSQSSTYATESFSRVASVSKGTSNGDAQDELDEPSVSPRKRRSGARKADAKVEAADEDIGDLDEQPPKKKVKLAQEKGKKRAKKYKGPAIPLLQYPERHWESKKFVGAHVSIAGAHLAPHRALAIGAKAFGLFTKTQKAWTGPPISEDSLRLFPMRCAGRTETIPDEEGNFCTAMLGDGRGFDRLKHVVPHGSYLTNLCNPDAVKRKKSYDNLLDELRRTESLGVGLFNIHPGSTTGACTREQSYDYIAECINDAHRATKYVIILLENMAAANNTVGGSFDDLAAIIERVEDKARIGICFDTCHAFAAGYDLRSPEAYEATMKELDKVVGLKFVKAFHLNDSVKGLGCHRDLHANIGTGEIGLAGFHNLMRDPRFDDIPFILETPVLSLSGSFAVEATKTEQMKGTAPDKAETSEEALEEKPEKEELALSLGASTWKLEIDLLHALEEVPPASTTPKIERLHQLISRIVADYQVKAAKAKEEGKANKQAKRAAKQEESSKKSKAAKKRRGGAKQGRSKDEDEDEEVTASEEEEDEGDDGCESHEDDE